VSHLYDNNDLSDFVMFGDEQFQKLLTVIESLSRGGIHWDQVVRVFLSALLAMIVGITLELIKRRYDRIKSEKESKEKELQKINAALVKTAYNIELLTHSVMLNILLHYEQSLAAFTTLRGIGEDRQAFASFAMSLRRYPALMMTCPTIHFLAVGFIDEMPFVVDTNPELIKNGEWINVFSKSINNNISDRNRFIESAKNETTKGALSYAQLDAMLQLQSSIATAERVTSSELGRALIKTARDLEGLSAPYKEYGKIKNVAPPDAFAESMRRLETISTEARSKMPV
jgi:hypothetical protein